MSNLELSKPMQTYIFLKLYPIIFHLKPNLALKSKKWGAENFFTLMKHKCQSYLEYCPALGPATVQEGGRGVPILPLPLRVKYIWWKLPYFLEDTYQVEPFTTLKGTLPCGTYNPETFLTVSSSERGLVSSQWHLYLLHQQDLPTTKQ